MKFGQLTLIWVGFLGVCVEMVGAKLHPPPPPNLTRGQHFFFFFCKKLALFGKNSTSTQSNVVSCVRDFLVLFSILQDKRLILMKI